MTTSQVCVIVHFSEASSGYEMKRERYANPMLHVVCVAKLCRPLRRAA
jgi:hypothetical protein